MARAHAHIFPPVTRPLYFPVRLHPLVRFEYVSGTSLAGGGPGRMEGALLVKDDTGASFEALVAPLTLHRPPEPQR